MFRLSFYITPIFVLLFSAYTEPTFAQVAPREHYYFAGFDNESHESQWLKKKQKDSNWCWAACMQMILRSHDIKVSQRELVKQAFDKVVNQKLHSQAIVSTFNNQLYKGESDSIFRLRVRRKQCDEREIINHLHNKRPLMVGLKSYHDEGHTYVLRAVYFVQNIQGKIWIDRVLLVDPSPTEPFVKVMEWSEFLRFVPEYFVVHVEKTGELVAPTRHPLSVRRN